MLNKKLLCVATAAALSSSLVQAEVKVGFLGGFTGAIESLTPPIYDGAKLAAQQVNAQGGLFDGEQLALPTADTTCVDAAAATNGADRLVNSEKVSAIVGALCSGATIAAANNVAVPGGVVMVSPASTSPAVSELDDRDLVFRTPPSDAYQGEVLARLLMAKGIEDAAVTYVNNDYGKGLADAFTDAYEAAGGMVLGNKAHEDGRADYRAELGALAANGSMNLVVLAYADGSGQTIVRQAYEGGNFTQFVGADGMVGEGLIKAVGADVLEGMIATKPGSPDLPGVKLYEQQAKAAGMDPSAVFAGQAYDAAFMLALALEAKGNADREGLKVSLRKVATAPGEVILPGEWDKAKSLLAEGQDINYEGATGAHEFDDNGDVPGVIFEMKVKDGSFVSLGKAE